MQYCFKCEVPYHKSMTCEQYQNLVKNLNPEDKLFYTAAFS